MSALGFKHMAQKAQNQARFHEQGPDDQTKKEIRTFLNRRRAGGIRDLSETELQSLGARMAGKRGFPTLEFGGMHPQKEMEGSLNTTLAANQLLGKGGVRAAPGFFGGSGGETSAGFSRAAHGPSPFDHAAAGAGQGYAESLRGLLLGGR